MLLCLYSHSRPKETIIHQVEHSLQGLGGQSHHDIPSKWSPSVWLVIPIQIVPPGTPLARLFGTGCPIFAWGGCTLKGALRVWVGQLACKTTGLRSHPTSSQLPDPGKGLPAEPVASHQWSYRWPADHPLLGPRHAGHSCMPQWDSWGPQRWPPALLTPLLQWLGCMCLRYLVHPWPQTPSTRHLHQCKPSPPCSIVESYNWQDWPPSSGSQCPALP